MKRFLTAACLVLLAVAFVAPAFADDFKEAQRNFAEIFRNPASTSHQRAQAIRRLAGAAQGKDAQKVVKELFNILKDRNLISDRDVQKHEAERDKLQKELDQIMETVKQRGNRITTGEQQRVQEIQREIPRLADLIQANNVCKNAACEALSRMTDPDAKAEIVKNITNRDENVASACIEAARLGRWSDAFDALCEAYNSSRDGGVRSLCVAALRVIDSRRAMPIFEKAINDDSFIARSHAVGGLRDSRSPNAVDLLIDRLEKEVPGRLKWDMVHALQDLTGKTEYQDDAAVWKAWWNRNKEGFAMPPPSKPEMSGGEAPAAAGDRATGTFYGIPIRTKNPIFVIDRSGSMLTSADINDPQADAQGQPVPPPAGKKSKWQALQDELFKAINGLPEDATFAIVWYSTEVSTYEGGKILKATESQKKHCEATIRQMNADGLTNIYEALQKGFEIATGAKMDGAVITGGGQLKADTIFFMTDGSPTCGPSVNGIAPTNPPNAQYSPALLEEICKWNERYNCVINCICVGQGDENFLKALAERNRGTYRKVTK